MAVGAESPHPTGPPTADTFSTLSSPSSIYRVEIPERLGQYTLRGRLGGGGMGDVYEAVQDEPRRVVALKLLRSIPSESDLARFRAEAQILGQFSHPAIAHIFEASTHERDGGSLPYIAMEHIPGAKTVTQYAEAAHLTVPERLALFARVCRAVDHAHSHQVIHRDLKPGNILVDESGNPKVIDFGVARFTGGEHAGWSGPTEVGQIVGTLRYMSPEQVEANPHALDARTDVYSLGVVLYELLCGRAPYSIAEAGFTEAVRIIQHRSPMPPRRCNPALDPDVESIVLHALAKDRDARYQSAGALAEDLERVARGGTPRWARQGRWMRARSRIRKFARRRPLVTAAMSAAAAWAAAVFVIVPLSRHPWLSDVPMPAPRPSPSADAAKHLEHVRIVAITDSTDMEALAARHGIEGIRNDHLRSWRRMHGALLTRLADAQPRAVATDISFPEPEPEEIAYDESLAAGARALHQTAPVFLAINGWDWSDASLDLSPVIGRELMWCGANAVCQESTGEWYVEVAAESVTAGFQPSFALLCYAALRYEHPRLKEVQFRLDPGGEAVRVQRLVRSPVNADIIVSREPEVRLPLSDHRRIDPSQDYVEASDGPGGAASVRVGYLHVPAPTDQQIDGLFVEYADAFNANDEERRTMFGGKIVLLANWRSGVDRVPAPDGRSIPGSTLHAAAMSQMLAASPAIVLARPREVGVIAAGGAMLGAVGALAGVRRRRLGIILVVGLTAGAVAGTFAASGFRGYVLHPLPPAAAVALAGFCVLAAHGRIGAPRPQLRSGLA